MVPQKVGIQEHAIAQLIDLAAVMFEVRIART